MIETGRLELIPLDERQLELWCASQSELERELGCDYRAEPLAGAFLAVVREQLETMKRDFDNYLWHTFWFFKDRRKNEIIGTAGFKGIPRGGAVEIGCGATKDFRKKSYVTEAVKAMCLWALRQPGIDTVLAKTEKWDSDSQDVLIKCGFERFKAIETYWWRLGKK